jgi:hypothetical protein
VAATTLGRPGGRCARVIVFRWIVGVLGALFAIGALFSFAVYISFSVDLWLRRARHLRQWLGIVFLLWFNVEVWGRVVVTIVRWNH